LLIKLPIYLFILLFAVIGAEYSYAQTVNKPDSLVINTDTLSNDTLKSKNPNKGKDDFKTKIVYSCKDSLIYSADYKKAYMYGDAKVNYGDIDLTAAYIEYDTQNYQVFAKGLKDTTGTIIGKPDYKQGSQDIKSDSMKYNFKSKQGSSFGIFTKQEDGYLHAEKTKRESNGNINIKNGKYTTCDAEHPHFYLALTKGVVIPDNKIVSGPAYLVLEDVPLPIGIPFGFFPNKRQSTSGILIPSYGEEITRGFYLMNGGYYFAFSDYFDARLTGDLYSKGTWGVAVASNYRKRYKFNGNVNIRYYLNQSGEKGVEFGPNILKKTRDFSIVLSHTQDPKSNPSTRVSASVNYTTSSFDRNFNYTDPQAMITNTKSSSVTYGKTWDNLNLSIDLRHSQNSRTKTVQANFPTARFTANRIYPFRPKNSAGDKWYHNISINYTSELTNDINATDSTIFTTQALKTAQNGFQHSIPLSANFKVLKYLNITPSISYSGMIKTNQFFRHSRDSVTSRGDTIYYFTNDTVRKLNYVQGFTPSINFNLNPTIYGMYTFSKNSKIQAIRHVITPSIGFSFVPGISGMVPNYYRQYRTGNKNGVDVMSDYSIYDGTKYGTPGVPRRSGSLSFGLNNSVEMKIKSAKDTVTGVKKVKILQSLNFSSSYDIYRDSMNLSPIRFSGSAPITEGLDITFSGTIDPYENDVYGRDINRFYWTTHGLPGRLTDFSTGFGYNFKSAQGKKTNDPNDKTNNPNDNTNNPNDNTKKAVPQQPDTEYGYFDVPWNFRFNYILNYQNNGVTKNFTQTLSFSGDVKLTKKLSSTVTSGYDFKSHQFSYTAFTITRDLHCWEILVNFSPFGNYKFYNFTIHAKSTILRDLKYEKRKDYRDFSGYSAY